MASKKTEKRRVDTASAKPAAGASQITKLHAVPATSAASSGKAVASSSGKVEAAGKGSVSTSPAASGKVQAIAPAKTGNSTQKSAAPSKTKPKAKASKGKKVLAKPSKPVSKTSSAPAKKVAAAKSGSGKTATAVKKKATAKKSVSKVTTKLVAKKTPKNTAKSAQQGDFAAFFGAFNETFAGLWESASKEAQYSQEQFISYGQDGIEELTRTAEGIAGDFSDAMELGSTQINTAYETGNAFNEMAKTMSNELIGFANALFSEQVENSRDLISCRTANELFDLQTNIFKGNLDMCFNEAVRISDIFFRFSEEASGPFNANIDAFSKKLAKKSAA